MAEDPREQSKNRKMHRRAWKVTKTKFRLNTQRVSYPLGRLRKGNLCLQSLWQKPSLLDTHREDKRRRMDASRVDRKKLSHPQIPALGEIAPEQQQQDTEPHGQLGGQPSALPATLVTL